MFSFFSLSGLRKASGLMAQKHVTGGISQPKRPSRKGCHVRRALSTPWTRPLLEILEDRMVPSALWYVNSQAVGDNTGQNWNNAFTDLQSALLAAQPGDQIWVAAGTYKPTSSTDRTISFVLDPGVAIYGGFAGTETQLAQRDWVHHVTALSGDIGTVGDNSDNSYHVVMSSGLDSNAILDGFTITAGNANGDPMSSQDTGAGMYNYNSSPTLTNVIISKNSASTFDDRSGGTRGGGMYNYKSSPTLTNVTFSNNSAYAADISYSIGDYGGGMFNDNSSPILTNVTFSNNSAYSHADTSYDKYGGGMFNNNSSPILANVIFSNNSAYSSALNSYDTYGGGMLNAGSSPILMNVTFSNNSAYNLDILNKSYSSGGGMFNNNSSPTLTNSILWGNSSSGSGDIQISDSAGTTTVSYSDVQGGWQGTGNIDADPLFVDAANGDLHLGLGSPVIDAGTNRTSDYPTVPLFDRDGGLRPQDGNGDGIAITDMGAYEAPALNFAPRVTTHPSNQTVTAGQNAAFTAAANGNPAPTVQWQLSTDGGKTFTNISGATSTTLTLTNVSFVLNGHEYRAVFTNSGGSSTTTAATLTVQTAPAFTSGNSATFTVCQGGNFTVTAVGSPTPTLTVSGALPGGVTFTNNGKGTASLHGIPAPGASGTYYFTIRAHNGTGSDALQNFVLIVSPSAPKVPPLLAFLAQLLGGIETVNAHGTSITGYFFGIPLLAATFDDSGNLQDATLLGLDITFLVNLLK